MARGWGSRIGIGFGIIGVVAAVSLIPAVWLAATISCWGVNVKDSLDPARYCGFGGLAGVAVAPVVGLIFAAVYVITDTRRQ
jgi:hypothetical protein